LILKDISQQPIYKNIPIPSKNTPPIKESVKSLKRAAVIETLSKAGQTILHIKKSVNFFCEYASLLQIMNMFMLDKQNIF